MYLCGNCFDDAKLVQIGDCAIWVVALVESAKAPLPPIKPLKHRYCLKTPCGVLSGSAHFRP